MVRHKFLAAAFGVLFLGLAGVDEALANGAWKEAGLGVASVLASAIYSPIKVHYAAVGAVTGGVAWVATGGDTELAQRIWEPALRGDYLITPQMLGGGKFTSRP